MKIAALFSFILHLFFIPFILFLFSDVRIPHPHTRRIGVSLRPTEFETSAHTPSTYALESPIPIEGPRLLPLGQDGEKLGEEPVTNAAYEILDQSALLTIRQWRFIPARKGGEAIPFWVNIPIKFHLH
jgi:hypothetical protein